MQIKEKRIEILHELLAFKQGVRFVHSKIYNLPSNINNKSTIYNLNSQARVFQAGVNLQSTRRSYVALSVGAASRREAMPQALRYAIGNLQSVD